MEKERKELELKELYMVALQKQLTAIADEKAKALANKESEVVSLLKRAEEERVAADAAKLADDVQSLKKTVESLQMPWGKTIQRQIISITADNKVRRRAFSICGHL